MICIVCNKEFSSKRKDAKFCSSTCRSNKFRKVVKIATDNPATDNATDNRIDNATDKLATVSMVFPEKKENIIPKDRWLCKIVGCNLINMPGHGGMCIYHWRKSEDLVNIPEQEYNLLNTGNPC